MVVPRVGKCGRHVTKALSAGSSTCTFSLIKGSFDLTLVLSTVSGFLPGYLASYREAPNDDQIWGAYSVLSTRKSHCGVRDERRDA